MERVLIANRGEIAVRIIRACKRLGIETVAIYSDVDKESYHVRLADEAVCIGPKELHKSYLNIPAVLSAARATDCDAIHPGFGFLSENPQFVRACDKAGIIFIGPEADVMEKMGDKAFARELFASHGVPVVPGSDGLVENIEAAAVIADEIGYPLLVKASAGGGGRGMRIAENADELNGAFMAARSEAKAAFGDDRVYMEKLIMNPRHIEVQVLADNHGNVLHLGTRDCTMQRRNQKMLEEAPAYFISPETAEKMAKAAVSAARIAGYKNAGTVEFVVDSDENFYFIEMNTRIQVEHPVTEMITGIDLVKAQLIIADGQELVMHQDDILFWGYAIECRINAEDPHRGFLPSPGKITKLNLPGGAGVRVDGSIYSGYTVLPYYDSMLLKLVIHAETREWAVAGMKQALQELEIEGISHNGDFHEFILDHPDFLEGKCHTRWIEQKGLPEYLE